ncbi:hypothetical protein MVES1_003184 [Malassezia vespertilionis]|uniref:uncharacterized protein n=1 Tax=Malassezia vespertilionis TaxID=2020962 RepID=UPI0024B1CE58|nr:uncharacterized protein MVES1_003184 [Malassezia vespertilionis]WFD07813.1 hypothetical protein MVES1_003184 [Malassezia vespertilionis]
MASQQEPRVIPTSASPSPPPTGEPAEVFTDVHKARAHLPVDEIVRIDLATRTKAAVDALYDLSARAADVRPSGGAHIGESINTIVKRLADIDAMRGHIHTLVPKDAVDLVDIGRNPDSHMRSFISRLVSENQYSRGQHTSILAFRNALGDALSDAFPALAPSIAEEMQETEEGTSTTPQV